MQATRPTVPDYPAGLSEQTVVVATCADCLEPYGEEFTVMFANREQAAKTITDDGWWIVGDKIQCDLCASRESCAEFGHIWGEWITARDENIQYRFCERCSKGEQARAQ